jgi:hypothetical protein
MVCSVSWTDIAYLYGLIFGIEDRSRYSTEASVNFRQTTRRNITEDTREGQQIGHRCK